MRPSAPNRRSWAVLKLIYHKHNHHHHFPENKSSSTIRGHHKSAQPQQINLTLATGKGKRVTGNQRKTSDGEEEDQKTQLPFGDECDIESGRHWGPLRHDDILVPRALSRDQGRARDLSFEQAPLGERVRTSATDDQREDVCCLPIHLF